MAYSSDIVTLGADHHWIFDGNSTDSIGSLASTDTSILFTGPALCEDVTNSMYTNADGDSVLSTASSDTSYAANDLMYAGWFQTNAIQQPPCRIIGDGGTTQSLAMYLGFGNTIQFECDYDTDVLQIYGDTPLVANRSYHLAIGYTSTNELVAYLDGVPQTNSADVLGAAMSTTRGAIRFGGTAGTSDYSIGGATLKLVSNKNGYYNQWCTFQNSIPSATQVREILFEKGALADNTISDQLGLDALSGTSMGNSPCNIRVTGNGTINLTADNITFDDLASIHVQYVGTGTLNWTNTNGSNASIGSTTNGGTINFINPSTLTLTGLKNPTEVRVFDAGTTTEVAGVENVTSGIFSESISVNSVDVRIVSLDYRIFSYTNLDMSTDTTIAVEQFFDRNYKNP